MFYETTNAALHGGEGLDSTRSRLEAHAAVTRAALAAQQQDDFELTPFTKSETEVLEREKKEPLAVHPSVAVALSKAAAASTADNSLAELLTKISLTTPASTTCDERHQQQQQQQDEEEEGQKREGSSTVIPAAVTSESFESRAGPCSVCSVASSALPAEQPESPEFLAHAKQELLLTIDRLPYEERAAFQEAWARAPAVVQLDSDLLRFLRFEQYHMDKAARRLCLYWTKRKALFGERSFKSLLTFSKEDSALTETELSVIRIGMLAPLPTDAAGRSVVLFDRSRCHAPAKLLSDIRARTTFHWLTRFSVNPKSQTEGFSILRIITKPKFDEMSFDRLMIFIKNVFPLKIYKFHICCVPPAGQGKCYVETVIPGDLQRLYPILLPTAVAHVADSQAEILADLEHKWGFSREGLPVTIGGTWTYATFESWYDAQRRIRLSTLQREYELSRSSSYSTSCATVEAHSISPPWSETLTFSCPSGLQPSDRRVEGDGIFTTRNAGMSGNIGEDGARMQHHVTKAFINMMTDDGSTAGASVSFHSAAQQPRPSVECVSMPDIEPREVTRLNATVPDECMSPEEAIQRRPLHQDRAGDWGRATQSPFYSFALAYFLKREPVLLGNSSARVRVRKCQKHKLDQIFGKRWKGKIEDTKGRNVDFKTSDNDTNSSSAGWKEGNSTHMNDSWIKNHVVTEEGTDRSHNTSHSEDDDDDEFFDACSSVFENPDEVVPRLTTNREYGPLECQGETIPRSTANHESGPREWEGLGRADLDNVCAAISNDGPSFKQLDAKNGDDLSSAQKLPFTVRISDCVATKSELSMIVATGTCTPSLALARVASCSPVLHKHSNTWTGLAADGIIGKRSNGPRTLKILAGGDYVKARKLAKVKLDSLFHKKRQRRLQTSRIWVSK